MKRIFIINQYSSNKGDRAVLYSLLSLLNQFSEIKITISTSTISEWQNPINGMSIQFVPWGWDYHPQSNNHMLKFKFFLLRRIQSMTYSILRIVLVNKLPAWIISPFINPDFLKAARDADLVISTGGHHITTLLSKNAVSSQLFDIACCHVLKKKIVLWSQSIGPLEFTNNRDRRFVKKLLMSLKEIYIRDKNSLAVLNELGVLNDNVHSTFETVISLNNTIENYISPCDRRNVIGISIYSTIKRSPEELAKYINSIAVFSNYCIEKYNCDVTFIPMELKNSSSDDRWLLNEIIKNIFNIDKCYMKDEDLDTHAHFELIQNCRYFVGHKTHSVIFALAAGTPLIGISYHVKTFEFMKQFGVEKFAIADKDLTSEKLISSFENLILDADNTGLKIFKRGQEMTQIIQQDFDAMINDQI